MSDIEILTRIERLERSSRIWKATAAIAIAACVFLATYGISDQSSAAQAPQQPALKPVIENDLKSTVYTNTILSSVTAEEVFLDCGLYTNVDGKAQVKLTHRVVMNFYTAKRLQGVLASIVQQ